MTADEVTIELLGRAGMRSHRGVRQMIVDSEILEGPKHSMCIFPIVDRSMGTAARE